MRLAIDHTGREGFDGRRRDHRTIIDEETRKSVGSIHSEGVGFGNRGGIYVSLFGDKYRGRFNRFEECWGFVKGVEAVLNYVTGIPEPIARSDETAE